ncbi:uncharacterized protein [Drosophila tropicalis]|uniref:uncharacterized protein n=1 Tax=Drosophila tropicalis TaxID=46794 RepID=UPI0035AC238B
MDQIMLNLMMSNPEDFSEEVATESNLISDGFEMLNYQCRGNCGKNIKCILQQAADTIKLKDHQIDNYVNTVKLKDRQIDNLITLALKKSPDLTSPIEPSNPNMERNDLNTISNYKDQLKSANEKIKSLKIQIQQLIEVDEMDEVDVPINNSAKKRKTNIEQIEAKDETKHQDKQKIMKKELWIHRSAPAALMIENNIAGPGWTVINRWIMDNGILTEDICQFLHVYELTKDNPHELYIHMERKDGGTSHAHFSNFVLGAYDDTKKDYVIQILNGLRKHSNILVGNFTGKAITELYDTFCYDCVMSLIMIREL